MTDNTAKKHYEDLLAEHYSWMFGDFDRQVENNLDWFQEHGIQPKSGQGAIDFGCGSGFQSIALASLGFKVTAVDFNLSLLDELKERDKDKSIETIHSDMLKPDNYARNAPFELAVCMGDTLPHLPSEKAVADFLGITYDLLEPGGNLILGFRDYSGELTGIDRFIPVQSDGEKIMTVFLEYDSDFVWVHDLVYEQNGDSWELEKSVYRKVRLSAEMVGDLLEKADFRIDHLQSTRGMVHVIAKPKK